MASWIENSATTGSFLASWQTHSPARVSPSPRQTTHRRCLRGIYRQLKPGPLPLPPLPSSSSIPNGVLRTSYQPTQPNSTAAANPPLVQSSHLPSLDPRYFNRYLLPHRHYAVCARLVRVDASRRRGCPRPCRAPRARAHNLPASAAHRARRVIIRGTVEAQGRRRRRWTWWRR